MINFSSSLGHICLFLHRPCYSLLGFEENSPPSPVFTDWLHTGDLCQLAWVKILGASQTFSGDVSSGLCLQFSQWGENFWFLFQELIFSSSLWCLSAVLQSVVTQQGAFTPAGLRRSTGFPWALELGRVAPGKRSTGLRSAVLLPSCRSCRKLVFSPNVLSCATFR